MPAQSALLDNVIDDLKIYHKNKPALIVLKDLIRLNNFSYLDVPESEKIETEIFKYITGYYGLNPTPKPESLVEQRLWVWDFLVQFMSKYSDQNELSSFDVFKEKIQKSIVYLPNQMTDHLVQQVSLFYLYGLKVFYELSQIGIKDAFDSELSFYEVLMIGVDSFDTRIAKYLRGRFNSADSLEQYLKKINFDFSKLKARNKFLLSDEHSHSKKTSFKDEKSKAAWKIEKEFLKSNVQINISGVKQDVPGDGTCYYHSVISNLRKAPIEKVANCHQKTRQEITKKIRENLDNPIYKFMMAKHISFYSAISLKGEYKGKGDIMDLYDKKLILSFLSEKIDNTKEWADTGTNPLPHILAYLYNWFIVVLDLNKDSTVKNQRLFYPGPVKEDFVQLRVNNNHFLYLKDANLSINVLLKKK